MSFDRRLKRIVIEGLKSIKAVDLELEPGVNILIGANGAGKSNFIEIFHLLNELKNKRLERYVKSSGGPNQLLRFGRKITKEILIQLAFTSNKYEAVLEPSKDSLLLSD